MAKYNLDNLKFIPIRAQLVEVELTEENVREAVNRAIAQANQGKQAKADVGPVGPNDKPRMLQMSAFIAHAGPPNRNRQAFRDTDLQKAVADGLFKAPYFGMIDYNHDFSAYGAWYGAEWAFDNEAGQWGILAHGSVWAWRYSDLADTFLAQQARQGYVDVSMSCLYMQSDLLHDADGNGYELIHNPIFLTTSLLDIPKGDKDARGLVSEDPGQSNQDRTAELLKASLADEAFNVEEEDMNELMQKIEALFGEQKAELKPLMDAVATLANVEEQLKQAKAEVERLTAELAEAKKAKKDTTEPDGDEQVGEEPSSDNDGDEPKKKKAKAEAELETATVALTTAQKEIERLTGVVTELQSFKSEIEEKAAKEAKEARAATRKAEIPEAVTETLNGMEKGEEILARWMDQSDDEWTVTKATFAIAAKPLTMAERSAKEGVLTGASELSEGGWEINKHLKK